MTILADKSTRLIVQGITGREGDFHARQMQAYSPIIVGGVTPGKGGLMLDYGVPVFDTVGQAVRETGVRVAGKLNWLHTASAQTLTHYSIDSKRGWLAHERIGILPTFGGVAVHDALVSYLRYTGAWAVQCTSAA